MIILDVAELKSFFFPEKGKLVMVKVAIIGGYGAMGRLFAKVLKKHGAEVVITGPREERGKRAGREMGVRYEKDNKKAASEADVVIVSVPIRKSVEVIREVAPAVKAGSMIMDLTSVKTLPCRAMERETDGGVEVLGCHPVFGPSVESLKGQNFVLCPIRGKKWQRWFEDIIRREGGRITIASPEEHDRVMGVVQGMTHFMLISAGVCMREMNLRLEESRKFASPVYQLIIDLIGRILEQDPNLYSEIQIYNIEAKKAREKYMEIARELEVLLSRGDKRGFIGEMVSAAKHFGDTKGAFERTQRILKDED